MDKSIFTVLLATVILFHQSHAQERAPLLKGTVNLSINEGTIDCSFVLSDIPEIEDYFIRINSGMNIRYLKSVDPSYPYHYEKSFYDTLSTGESNAYFFQKKGGKEKFLPQSIEFSYVGKYPVFHDSLKDYSAEDWKGNISFNGYSVRADGRQSAWYPVLYDIKKDLVYDKIKYDLEINCSDCRAIYLNGSAPITGSKGSFKSDIPQEIAVFSGKYKFSNQNGTYFLNPDITEMQIEDFGNVTNKYKKFYFDKLSIPYDRAITYIQTTPTSEKNSWLFVSYPTIVCIGRNFGMKSFFDPKLGDSFKTFIAHELGHYYFGTYRRFNSELGDMMTEGFSEFLAFKVAKNLIGDSVYNKKIRDKIRALRSFQAIPFGKIKSHADYQNRELYVYYFAPIVFTAIEKEIGEVRMWKWLRALLEAKGVLTNYSFVEETLNSVLQNTTELEHIKSNYFFSDKAIENAIRIVAPNLK